MAKYASFDRMYKCVGCEIEVARHHIDCDKGVRCPNCDHFAFWHADACEQTAQREPTSAHGGIFVIQYKGLGTVPLPRLVVEEIKWIPSNEQPCPVCRRLEWHLIHEYNIYDAAHRYVSNNHPMYGTDIVRDGSSVYFPFQSNWNIWIDQKPVDYAKLWCSDTNSWNYSL